MAASHTPVERATLALEIAGYSLHKGTGARRYIGSTRFSVGGYEWCIAYYPDKQDGNGCISVYFWLVNRGAEVRALFDLRLINRNSGLSFSLRSYLKSPRVFSRLDDLDKNSGVAAIVKASELEASALLHDDCLVIECDLTVIKEPLVDVHIPPSNLSDTLGNFLNTGEEADVTFKVNGEVFPAHKILLAMRSPVFKAELYGQMRDRRGHEITVVDMQPAVFKALLHFIYTDSLPSMVDLDDDDEIKEMVKHLLVAADRYALERLKSICESILCKCLDAESVATVLGLADRHQCSTLKDACVEFAISANTMCSGVASQEFMQVKRSCRALCDRVTKPRKI